jgi:Transcriptional regulatory protein, C terminal
MIVACSALARWAIGEEEASSMSQEGSGSSGEEVLGRLHMLEDSLRLLLANVPAITWTTDSELRFTSIEGPALGDLKLVAEDVVGQPLGDVRQDGDDPVFLSPQALDGKVASSELRWMGQRIRCTIEPLKDSKMNIVGTMGVAVLLEKADQADEVRSLRSAVHDARIETSGSHLGAAIRVGDLLLSPAAFAAWKGKRRLLLSSNEFRLLLQLAESAGDAMTRKQLLQKVWGYEEIGRSRLVDMTVSRLRHKIEDDPRRPTRLLTVRGVGYRLED